MPAFNERRSPSVAKELARLKKKFRRIEEDFDVGLGEIRDAADWLGDAIPGYDPRTFKLRIAIKSARIGKSGGLRLIYRPVDGTPDVVTALLYHKGDAEDFTSHEFERALAAIRPEIEPSLRAAGLTPQQIDELFTP